MPPSNLQLVFFTDHPLMLSLARDTVHVAARGAQKITTLLGIGPTLAVGRETVERVRHVGFCFAQHPVQPPLPFLIGQ